MQEKKKGALVNKGYLISTMKCFFTLFLYSHALRVGEGKQYALIEVAFKREKKIFREVRILGLPGWHYCSALVLFEKYFSIPITEPSGLFPEHSIHCFTIADSAEGCAQGSAKNQFFQYKHPFCRKLKQKKNAIH